MLMLHSPGIRQPVDGRSHLLKGKGKNKHSDGIEGRPKRSAAAEKLNCLQSMEQNIFNEMIS